MTRLRRRIAIGVLVAIGSAGGASAQTTCDRACLRTMLDQYLDAVVKHDPKAAPLVVGFRQTENAINVAPGNGVWKTVTGLGKMQRRYLDPVSGQAGYYGTGRGGRRGRPSSRCGCACENRSSPRPSGIWPVANDPGLNGPRQPGRPPANLLNPDYLIANPPPDRVVPRAQRLVARRAGRGRQQLLRRHHVARRFGRARRIPAAACGERNAGAGRARSCRRVAPAAPAAPAEAAAGAVANDCVAGLANFNLSMVVARRIPLVDEEAQVVLGLAVFIRRPGSPTPRNVFSEWFNIEEAKIRTIYTAMFYPPPTLAVPNWPPYDGNWPLPAAMVPAPAPTARP